ncbi:MAG: FABP family protein [Frankiaceae bacterium]
MPDSPELPAVLAPLAFLLGTWRGEGVGGYPTIEGFTYGQEVSFSWYGKPVLAYSSRTWALDNGRPMAVESGFWRPGAGGVVEVTMAHPTGIVELYYGEVRGTQVELATDVVARTTSAKDVSALKRLYGLVEGELMYAIDMAAVGQPMQPHLSARLARV